MAWLGTWAHRRKITISNANVDDTLSNFPIFINISSSSGTGSTDLTDIFDDLASDSNRKKIAITTSDGITQCYVEIERWNDASEVAELWVKVPSVSDSAETYLYIYYDANQDNNTTYIGDTTDAVTHNVWDSDFIAVWHMAQDPNGDGADAIKDSTSSGKDATPGGSMTTADLVSAQCGLGIDFDGSDDYLDLGSIGADDPLRLDSSDVTIEAIINNTTGGDTYGRIIDKSDGAGMTNGYGFNMSALKIMVIVDGNQWRTTDDVISYGTAYGIAGIITSSAFGVYVNGASKAGSFVSGSATQPPDETTGAKIARVNYVADQNFYGIIDEIRVSKIERNAAWIKATYYSNFDNIANYGNVEISPDFAGIGAIDQDIIISLSSVELPCITSISCDLYPGALIDLASSFDLTTSFESDLILSLSASMSAQSSLDSDLAVTVPDASLAGTVSMDALPLDAFSITGADRVYIFTFTGAADGTTDITIPIASFQCRIKDGDPTYLSVVIPGLDYLSYINARLNGDLVVRMGYKKNDTILLTNIIAIVDFDSIRYDEGPNSASITLDGYRTESYLHKTVPLQGVSYKNLSSGKLRFRCTPDLYLRPGDTATYGSDTFTVDSITHSVSVAQETYEVAE